MPSLPHSCTNTSKQGLPSSAPRVDDVLFDNYNVIAIVPWLSQDCTRSYLAAANRLASALITYVPDNSTEAPPPVSDEQWFLNDGGRWKSDSQFPVYAIPGASGFAIAQQLGIYSGNVSSIRNGSFSSIISDPTDYIRLYTSIQTNTQSSLPSLWAFLLVVLGTVLVLMGFTSFAMHYYQRRARNGLRLRVVQGEVDLEALGIRRLTIPQDVLDKLPLYVYTSQKGGPIKESTTSTQLPRHNSESAPASPAKPATAIASGSQQVFQQPMCAVCLEDFVPNSITVKELPCRHVYHPECIDEVLRYHSSLCPVCKTTVLPSGYCPTMITHAMVRRERQARRLPRQRQDPQIPALAVPSAETPRRHFAVGNRMASFHRQFGRSGRSSRSGGEMRIFSTPEPQWVEMSGRTTVPAAISPGEATPPLPSQPPLYRAERARRRVSALLGHRAMAVDEEREQRDRQPKCKSTLP